MPTINGDAGDNTIGGAGVPVFNLDTTNSSGVVENAGGTLVGVSADGTKVLFVSSATNLGVTLTTPTGLFVKDLVTGQVTMVNTTNGGYQFAFSRAAFTPDGQHVIFASFDTTIEPAADGANDLFIKDLATGVITDLSVGPGGVNANSNTSFWEEVYANTVLVNADATNLGPTDTNGKTDVYALNLTTGVWSLLSTNSAGQQGNNFSVRGALSPDGTMVVFNSMSTNLAAGDTNTNYDVYVKNLTTGQVTLVSADANGVVGNAASGSESYAAHISPNNRYVLFESAASNLVANDTNNATDIFLKDLKTGAIIAVSSDANGVIGNAGSTQAYFSADGSKVIFTSAASNLIAGDTNHNTDVFIKDLATGAVTRVSLDINGQQINGGGGNTGRMSNDGTIFFRTVASLLGADNNGANDVYSRGVAGGGLDPNQSYTIHGNGGNDTITGGALTDKLYGDDGNDRLFGGGGADQLYGGDGTDILSGGDANDTLDGGAGADAMSGGTGNDVYYVDDAHDTTVEAANEGVDVVRASISWTLMANTENLELQGTGNINGTGNELANNITGNSGNNTLDGGAGTDTLNGGGGDDRLIGGAGGDTLTGGTGADTFVLTNASINSTVLGTGTLETDTVKDLSKAEGDKLDLSAVDADIGQAGDQAFHLVTAFSHHAAEMTLAYTASNNTTLLKLDVDGDGKADYQMKITGDVHLDSGGWIL